jgi:hypothetical protein
VDEDAGLPCAGARLVEPDTDPEAGDLGLRRSLVDGSPHKLTNVARTADRPVSVVRGARLHAAVRTRKPVFTASAVAANISQSLLGVTAAEGAIRVYCFALRSARRPSSMSMAMSPDENPANHFTFSAKGATRSMTRVSTSSATSGATPSHRASAAPNVSRDQTYSLASRVVLRAGPRSATAWRIASTVAMSWSTRSTIMVNSAGVT